jgi:hypothetical protein
MLRVLAARGITGVAEYDWPRDVLLQLWGQGARVVLGPRRRPLGVVLVEPAWHSSTGTIRPQSDAAQGHNTGP